MESWQGAGMRTSRLGFGCGSLMASRGPEESLRLLHTAFEHGVTHYDVARSYGYGEAEGIVGRFLAGRRDSVTVTTKAGVLPPPRLAAGRGARAARRVAGASPRLRAALRRGAGRMVAAGRFELAALRSSLDRSLRELGTDHVDILLLHDVDRTDIDDDVRRFAEEALTSGRAREVGVGTSRDAALAIAASTPELARVVQVPDPLPERPASAELLPAAELVITHVALGRALAALRSRPGALSEGRPDLAPLLVALALARNPTGTVLTASRDVAHLEANLSVLSRPPDPADVAGLAEELAHATSAVS